MPEKTAEEWAEEMDAIADVEVREDIDDSTSRNVAAFLRSQAAEIERLKAEVKSETDRLLRLMADQIDEKDAPTDA